MPRRPHGSQIQFNPCHFPGSFASRRTSLCPPLRQGFSSLLARPTTESSAGILNDGAGCRSGVVAMTSIIAVLYSCGQNSVCQNPGVDSRFAGHGCMENNERGPARRCPARLAVLCISTRDSKSDRFLRTSALTARRAGTEQGQSRPSPRC